VVENIVGLVTKDVLAEKTMADWLLSTVL